MQASLHTDGERLIQVWVVSLIRIDGHPTTKNMQYLQVVTLQATALIYCGITTQHVLHESLGNILVIDKQNHLQGGHSRFEHNRAQMTPHYKGIGLCNIIEDLIVVLNLKRMVPTNLPATRSLIVSLPYSPLL